jgi:hypothetical protein
MDFKKEKGGRMHTGLIWFVKGPVAGSCEHGKNPYAL